MKELTKNAALVSMEEWNAIHAEMRRTFANPEHSLLSADEFQAAAQQVQPLLSD